MGQGLTPDQGLGGGAPAALSHPTFDLTGRRRCSWLPSCTACFGLQVWGTLVGAGATRAKEGMGRWKLVQTRTPPLDPGWEGPGGWIGPQ